MAWKEVTAVKQRVRFMQLLEEEKYESVAALCRDFDISRKTAYKWIDRYRLSGDEGLSDLSRAAHTHPNAISDQIEQLIIEAWNKYPKWGAKKLLRYLQGLYPARHLPCRASVSTILDRNQLVRRRKCRRPIAAYNGSLSLATMPNDLWAIDHKGWWQAGNGDRCEPLTISDLASRFLIRCALARGKGFKHVYPIMTAAFKEYGLPLAIRSDNGPPFASRAPLGLCHLSVWLLRLGIIHERIQAGKPQQNGCHERMHLTMLQERIAPIGNSLRQEQNRLNQWRETFNYERPHEALGLDTPASHFNPSPRPMPARLPALEYPAHMKVRRVCPGGQIGWKGKHPFLTEALSGEPIGFEPTDEDGIWKMWLGNMHLGSFDEKTLKAVWANTATRRTD